MRELEGEERLDVAGGELGVAGVDPSDRLRQVQERQLARFLEQYRRFR